MGDEAQRLSAIVANEHGQACKDDFARRGQPGVARVDCVPDDTHVVWAAVEAAGGPIGLLKSHATRSAHEIADEAVNIFGGRGLTQGGMGRVVEQFHRTYKFDAILGGTEEILGDLGVRQAMKQFPKSML